MKLLRSPRGDFDIDQADADSLVGQAVISLKSVILGLSMTEPSPQKLVARLAKQLPTIANPNARASVFWLVGQYAASEGNPHGLGWEGVQSWVPDVLRQAVKSFAEEVSARATDLISPHPPNCRSLRS
jgi:AP-3 complex subunit beta